MAPRGEEEGARQSAKGHAALITGYPPPFCCFRCPFLQVLAARETSRGQALVRDSVRLLLPRERASHCGSRRATEARPPPATRALSPATCSSCSAADAPQGPRPRPRPRHSLSTLLSALRRSAPLPSLRPLQQTTSPTPSPPTSSNQPSATLPQPPRRG